MCRPGPLRLLILLALLCLTLPGSARAAEIISLRVAALPENRHLYYTRLLEESLRAAGYQAQLVYVGNLSQPRIWSMVSNSQLSLIWGVQTDARDQVYAAVANPLTNGLIGQRILLVKKGQENTFSQVRTLDDFRRLGKVGGLGLNWFDVEVWKANALPVYVKDGDWSRLFRMMSAGERGIDYMTRGVTEVVTDAKAYKGLAIEPHLLLSYDRDMRFYLSPEAARYRAVIESALAQADRSGLKKRLIEQHFLSDVKTLNLDKRVTLKLTTDASASAPGGAVEAHPPR